MLFCSRPENPLFPRRPGPYRGLSAGASRPACDGAQTPARRPLGAKRIRPHPDNGCAAWPAPVAGFPARRSVRRAGADSPSATGKQAKYARGGRSGSLQDSPREHGHAPPEAGSAACGHGHQQEVSLPGRLSAGCAGKREHRALPSPLLSQERKEGPLSESLHLSDQSGMRITSWIYAHRAVRRAGPCCGSRYGRCRTGA